nr:MAG TPA: hypothetical protein [Caudoviricetes sp.]
MCSTIIFYNIALIAFFHSITSCLQYSKHMFLCKSEFRGPAYPQNII